MDQNEKATYSSIVSLQVAKAAVVRVAPNPSVDGKIHLKLTENTTVQLLTPDGQVLFNGPLDAGPHEINVSGKAKGIYLLRAGTTLLRVMVR